MEGAIGAKGHGWQLSRVKTRNIHLGALMSRVGLGVLSNKPLSAQASMSWQPQPHHVMVEQAEVRYSTEDRSTARASTTSAFLRKSFILLQGKTATLSFWQAHEKGSLKEPFWE